MSYALSIGLDIPVRASDQGPPDPIECVYDLEGPEFYVTYDDGEKGDNVMCVLSHVVTRNTEDSYISYIESIIRDNGSVAIEYGWRWRLEGGDWMFAHKEKQAEEDACEAYMESIEDDYHDI
jgi:hypothetical protein